MRKTIAIVGLITGIFFIFSGLSVKIPDREFSYSEAKTYVGGDAYNYIIESGVRGGQIAGASAAKAIYCTIGTLIVLYSAFRLLEELDKPALDVIPLAHPVIQGDTEKENEPIPRPFPDTEEPADSTIE